MSARFFLVKHPTRLSRCTAAELFHEWGVKIITRTYFLFRAKSIATAIATVAPTIGLLPMPRKPIIST